MNEELRQIIRAAAVGGCWTVLIGAIWLSISWLIWMGILKSKPDWLIKLWGGNITWDQVQSLTIVFMAVAKMILWVCILATIWLMVWSS